MRWDDCSDTLPAKLLGETSGLRLRAIPDDDLVEIAVDAALARTPDEQARALAELAAALRRRQDGEGALRVLDIAWSLRPSPHVEAVVYACAVAAHCDADRFDVARTIGEEALGRWCDSTLLRTLGRAYIGLYLDTSEPEYIERAQRLFDEADPREPDSLPLARSRS